MRRAYSYIRFSKKDQANGDSLRRQLAASKAYCEQKGLLLDEGFNLHDLGISAFQGKNAEVGALGSFLEAVRQGRVPKGSVLIIESLDRLSRSEIDEAFDLFRGLLKSGIDIVTLTPEREYTKANVKDIVGLLEPLFIMSRAHEESATKSRRIREAFDAKRSRLHEQPFTTKCPAWLQPKADGKGFEQIPEAVELVRRIYELAREGHGVNAIAGKLNRDGVPSITGRRAKWNNGYIGYLLRTRAVLGEYQPFLKRGGKRIPHGEPIRDYFPAIMTEEDWFKTRLVVEQRSVARGRIGKKVMNLFTGIIFDARDGCSMVLRTKGSGRKTRYLISSGSVHGNADTPQVFFPYETIESYFLCFLNHALYAELVVKQPDGAAEKIARLTATLVDLDRRIQAVERAIEEEADYEEQLVVLRRLAKKKKAAAADLEKVKQEQTSNDAETLGQARSISNMLAKCPPEELPDLRTRLKASIRSLVESIWVLPEGTRSRKVATVQVFFRSGKCLHFLVHHPDPGSMRIAFGNETAHMKPKDDLRQWRKQKVQPSFMPEAWPEAQAHAKVMGSCGYPSAEITFTPNLEK